MKKRILIIAAIIVLLAAAVGYSRVNESIQSRLAMPAALAYLESDDLVQVSQSEWIVLQPANGQPDTGFIFFTGGYVDVRSYAPVAHALAENGFLVVLIDSPLSTALLSLGEPAKIVKAFPEIQHWAAGGHSLGGVAAARTAYDNPGLLEGVVLWAAAPASDNDIAQQNISVLGIYGSEDKIYPIRRLDRFRELLPADSVIVEIEGANHAQFGRYGDGTQFRDGTAMITREEQEMQVADLTAGFLETLSTP